MFGSAYFHAVNNAMPPAINASAAIFVVLLMPPSVVVASMAISSASLARRFRSALRTFSGNFLLSLYVLPA